MFKRLLGIVNCMLLIAIVAVAVMINKKETSNKELEMKRDNERLSEWILYEKAVVEDNLCFRSFADKETDENDWNIGIRIRDIMYLEDEMYEDVQISMWDDSLCTPEWYGQYFERAYVNSEYIITAPQDMTLYLRGMIDSGHKVSNLYFNVDPVTFPIEYYERTYYEADAMSYEEYLTDVIFPLLNNDVFGNVVFFMPVKSVKDYCELSEEERAIIYASWYKFLMYLHWCPKIKVAYLGAEEWLVAKDSNFLDDGRLIWDLEELVYLYEYAYDEYRVNAPIYKVQASRLEENVLMKQQGGYCWEGLEDKSVVFFGDSVLNYSEHSELFIPEYFKEYTSADCYNLSIGGTNASDVNEYNFVDMTEFLSRKEGSVSYERQQTELERLFECDNSSENMIFVINYGFNDYFQGNPVKDGKNTEYSYEAGLTTGIENLKETFPGCEILVLSPYYTGIGNGGKDKLGDNGSPLKKYIETAKKVADFESVKFVNMYDELGITEKNVNICLADKVHMKISGNIKFAEIIYKNLCDQASE